MAEAADQPSEAGGWYRKALRADPLNGYAHLRYARFLAHTDSSGLALKHAERATRLLPESAYSWQLLATIHAAVDEPERALAAYQRSLAIEPLSGTRQQMIDLLRKMGDHQRAEKMQQALDAYNRYRHP